MCHMQLCMVPYVCQCILHELRQWYKIDYGNYKGQTIIGKNLLSTWNHLALSLKNQSNSYNLTCWRTNSNNSFVQMFKSVLEVLILQIIIFKYITNLISHWHRNNHMSNERNNYWISICDYSRSLYLIYMKAINWYTVIMQKTHIIKNKLVNIDSSKADLNNTKKNILHHYIGSRPVWD